MAKYTARIKMKRAYYISDNYNRSFRSVVAARKEIMRMYQGFELRAVSIPVVDNAHTVVGTVLDPGTNPRWQSITRVYETWTRKTIPTVHEWVLNKNGTLGKKIREQTFGSSKVI